MPHHETWATFRDRWLNDDEVRGGYEQADRAIIVGDAVREARMAAGMTQAELARRVGITRSMIDRLELGGIDPRLSLIERISQAVNTDLIILLRPREDALSAG